MFKFMLYTLAIPFLYLNYKIVIFDLKNKKIPNKYLWYLLLLIPFYYTYLIFSFPEINYLLFLLQIFLTFLISFILYSFWVWSAWDAKYLLVLSLFIPHIWIIPFIWNIALLTLIYLLLYFIWFYFWKCLFNWKYTKSLYKNIFNDLKDKFLVFIKHWDGNIYRNIVIKKVLYWFIFFLIIFVSIRLSRIYIFNEIFNENWWSWRLQILESLLEKYHFYFVFWIILIFVWTIWLIKLFYSKIKLNLIEKFKNMIFKKYKIFPDIIDFIFLWVLALALLSFIIYEFVKNPLEIKNYIYKIFTIYLWLYIIIKILIYSYKITFQIAETYYIDIKDLKEWDIVDKEYLMKMFGKQEALWYCPKSILEEEIINERKRLLLYPAPNKYFSSIHNPVNKDDIKLLKKIYKIVNTYHTKNTHWYIKNSTIKILKTFAFWWYLFIWFIITYFFENSIITNLVKYFLDLVNWFYN